MSDPSFSKKARGAEYVVRETENVRVRLPWSSTEGEVWLERVSLESSLKYILGIMVILVSHSLICVNIKIRGAS